MADEYTIANWEGVQLAWKPELDGGGRLLRHDFIPVVQHLFGRVNRLCEFCAGPGFIGFSLLGLGLCDHLVLIDVNPRAIDAINETVRLNGFEDEVTAYLSDGLNDIPEHERWDLVVSAPPSYPFQVHARKSLILDDPDWQLHRDFYRRVGDFLAPGGSVLFEENAGGGPPEDFVPMIADGGLSHMHTLWYSGAWSGPYWYFMWSQKQLPGLAFDRRLAVTLALREPAGEPTVVPAGRPCEISLTNETGRPVQPRLFDQAGADQLDPWMRRDELAPGAHGRFEVLGFKAGEYEVRDRAGDSTLARLVAVN